MDLQYLFTDPRPELIQDTNLWTKLFSLIPELENKQATAALQKHLWAIRCFGVMLKPAVNGLRFEPIVGPDCAWEYEVDFEEMKIKYLKPYVTEITWLLKKVMEP
jgi:hypothetical protein